MEVTDKGSVAVYWIIVVENVGMVVTVPSEDKGEVAVMLSNDVQSLVCDALVPVEYRIDVTTSVAIESKVVKTEVEDAVGPIVAVSDTSLVVCAIIGGIDSVGVAE